MGKHMKTVGILEACQEILAASHPMTLRQTYYQLVARQLIENKRSSYQGLSKILRDARKDGTIPWEWIEDRLRRPRTVGMWDSLADFSETAVRAYRKNVWATQEGYCEVWVEKDALSGIFENVLNRYGITLNVGRGYDGWSSLHDAGERYAEREWTEIVYFGDFDPSGEDMVRSLEERIGFFTGSFEIVKAALTKDDIKTYDLPPDPTKATDSRAAAFVAEHGDIAVELDALPPDVLRERIVSEVEKRMDLEALEELRQVEKKEKAKLAKLLSGNGRKSS